MIGEPPGSAIPASPPDDRCTDSLVLVSLEIGRALADRGRATFRAQGACLYPAVWPHLR